MDHVCVRFHEKASPRVVPEVCKPLETGSILSLYGGLRMMGKELVSPPLEQSEPLLDGKALITYLSIDYARTMVVWPPF
jgi:hypothetical protein